MCIFIPIPRRVRFFMWGKGRAIAFFPYEITSIMKRIYRVLIFGIVIATALSLWAFIECDIPFAYVSLGTSAIAIIISVISLSIADPKLKELELAIAVWGRNKKEDGYPMNLVFEVLNRSKKPIFSPTFHFRAPNKIFKYDTSRRDQKYQVYKYGETILALNDQFHFLGTNDGDRKVRFDHQVDLSDWQKGYIYFSIHCKEHKVKTVKLGKDDIENIRSSNNKSPIVLGSS